MKKNSSIENKYDGRSTNKVNNFEKVHSINFGIFFEKGHLINTGIKKNFFYNIFP